MYSQCPECLSVFSLDARTLSQANGHVICGHCRAGFDSLATLTEQLPPAPFLELPLNPPSLEPPQIDLVVYRPAPEVAVIAEPDDGAHGEDFSKLVFAPRFTREKTARQHQARRRNTRTRRRDAGERRWPWVVACMILALLLGCQLTWAERDALIRNPLLGSWLRSGCATLGCELPLVSAPEKIRLVASNVQAHPSVPGALMISASVRNDAAFAQPWPIVDLTLSDAHGRTVAMRRLQPHEYLDDATALSRGLAPGAGAVLLLEVEDPGRKAVAFEFAFE